MLKTPCWSLATCQYRVLSRNDTKKVRPNTALVKILLRLRTVISRLISAPSCASQLLLLTGDVAFEELLLVLLAGAAGALVPGGAELVSIAWRVAATACFRERHSLCNKVIESQNNAKKQQQDLACNPSTSKLKRTNNKISIDDTEVLFTL